ncbi:hypothetical protein ACQSSU_03210 [Micromonospora echinospora]
MIGEHHPMAEPRTVLAVLANVPGLHPHLPDRPTWRCAGPACPDPWPCPWARAHIGAAWGRDRIGLATFMNRVLEASVRDLIDTPGDHDLYGRLIEWTR